jgi:hypothetical protein
MEDSSLLIAQTTIPLGCDVNVFFNNEFNYDKKNGNYGLFKGFSDSLKEYSIDYKKSTKSEWDTLYVPIPYLIFGSYDLAILSLIDDFSLGNRIFGPLHTYRTPISNYNYKYQIISGIANNISDKYGSITDFAKRTFLSKENIRPWLAITRLKINNGLLIGTGVKIIELIQNYISYLITKNYYLSKLDLISILSFDSYEITVVAFSDKYSLITELISEIRTSSIERICALMKINPEIFKISLLGKYYDHQKFNDLRNCHIFTNTHTTIGVDLRSLYSNIKLDETVNLLVKLDVKPGHLGNVLNLISKIKHTNISLCPGESTLLLSSQFNDSELFIPTGHEISSIKGIYNHINKIDTLIYTQLDQKDITLCTPEHSISLTLELSKSSISFGIEDIIEIKKKLCSIGFSKVVTDRLIRMLGDYNQCIKDPFLFVYFCELYSFLVNVCNLIHNQVDKISQSISSNSLTSEVYELHKFISLCIDQFEKAYYCRLHQGYNFQDISDINLEFNGGIQNLLSGYNEFYAALTKLVAESYNKSLPESFILVSTDDRISSDWPRIRINYMQLFHPELFFSVMGKEAFNNVFASYLPDDIHNSFENQFLTTSQSFSFFLNRLELSADFKDTLNTFIKNEGLTYYIVDFLTFRLSYNNDYGQFYYWYMMNLIQTPEVYGPQKKPDKKKFIQMVFRLMLVLFTQKNERIINDFARDIFYVPFDSILSEHWRSCIQDFRTLFEFKPFLKGNSTIDINNVQPILLIFKDISCTANSIFIKLLKQENPKEKYDYSLALRRISKINTLRNSYLKSLNEGIPVFYDNAQSPTEFISAISLAYLTLCSPPEINKRQAMNGKKHTSKPSMQFINYVQKRDSYGLPINIQKLPHIVKRAKVCSPFLIDMQGGVFTISFTERKFYLRIRSMMIMSMMDFALKRKIRYFTKENICP